MHIVIDMYVYVYTYISHVCVHMRMYHVYMHLCVCVHIHIIYLIYVYAQSWKAGRWVAAAAEEIVETSGVKMRSLLEVRSSERSPEAPLVTLV